MFINMSVVIPFISQLPMPEQQEWLTQLNTKLAPHCVVLPSQMTAEQIKAAEVAIIANPEPSELQPFSNLVWVQSLWAGVDRLFKEIPTPWFNVARLEDPMLAQTMAEAVLTWSLYLHRQIPQYMAQQQLKQWRQHSVKPAAECNISILGLGKLGALSAQRLVDNGFNVSGWSNSQKTLANITCYSGDSGLTEMLEQCHILVILLPLTPETEQLVNKRFLAKLPQGASIINFARGGVIDIEALVNGLDNNHLSHAVLDVFEHEPLPATSSLWQHQKISVLPHISAPTNLASASHIICQNILDYLNNKTLPNTVDSKRSY